MDTPRAVANNPTPESAPTTDASAPASAPPRRRRRWTWRRRLATGALSIVVLVVLGVGGTLGYLHLAEWRNPSGRVYIETNGQRQFLEQPKVVVTPRPRASAAAIAPVTTSTPVVRRPSPPPAAPATPTAIATRSATAPSPTTIAAAPDVPLPPLHLTIPDIGVDIPIVLADNQHLPRVKVAGWFFKSAFPATAGNMVILGHVNGQAETFARLNELHPGDTIRITTANAVHIYVVDSTQIVDESAVEVLAPTTDPIATLITCAGDWNPAARSFNKRLVVRASYAAVEPR